MRAFRVSVNGEHLCTAGIPEDGVLTSMVDWVGSRNHDHFSMRVGGLDSVKNCHLNWKRRSVWVGDEITTKILELSEVDPPEEESPSKRDISPADKLNDSIRSLISECWMLLPEERRDPDSLEAEVRRLVERNLKGWREDYEAFDPEKPF
jgi:hypothetical protein